MTILHKKIIASNFYALQCVQIEQSKFEVLPGQVSYITFNGAKLFAFHNVQEANQWRDELNVKFLEVTSGLHEFYHTKIEDILNGQ